jgi:hypothetical protein
MREGQGAGWSNVVRLSASGHHELEDDGYKVHIG